MPVMSICNYPGCTTLVLQGWCQKHQAAKFRIEGQRTQANKQLYNSKRWRKLRAYKLGQEPLCEIRELCNGIPATEVDHITPIEAGGSELDMANLQSCCKRCHSWKTISIDIPKIREFKERANGQSGQNRY